MFIIEGIRIRKSQEPVKPVPFMTLSSNELKNVSLYNYEVSRMYFSISCNMILTTVAGVIDRRLGSVVLITDFLLGLPLLARRYQRILKQCSKELSE